MKACANCGNDYDRMMRIQLDDSVYDVDCFECAINLLAPECLHCGTKIIGHGTQYGDQIFCCAHCARKEGHPEIQDRVAFHHPF